MRILPIAILASLALAAPAAAQTGVNPPAGHVPFDAGFAVGVQTYKCNGTSWAFTGPRATVYALSGKIDHYAGETIAYTAERVDGDEASVQSRVVTAKGSQIPVEYRLHRVNDDWSAYDVFVENVSLVGTYRSQFDRIIRSESFASLLRRLREKGQVAEAR